MKPLTYKNELPTKAGWYWRKWKEWDCVSKNEVINEEVVRVRYYVDCLAVGNCPLDSSDAVRYRWAGPIPPPTSDKF